METAGAKNASRYRSIASSCPAVSVAGSMVVAGAGAGAATGAAMGVADSAAAAAGASKPSDGASGEGGFLSSRVAAPVMPNAPASNPGTGRRPALSTSTSPLSRSSTSALRTASRPWRLAIRLSERRSGTRLPPGVTTTSTLSPSASRRSATVSAATKACGPSLHIHARQSRASTSSKARSLRRSVVARSTAEVALAALALSRPAATIAAATRSPAVWKSSSDSTKCSPSSAAASLIKWRRAPGRRQPHRRRRWISRSL